MGKNGLLNVRRLVVASPMSFTDNSSVRYFNRYGWERPGILWGQERGYKVK